MTEAEMPASVKRLKEGLATLVESGLLDAMRQHIITLGRAVESMREVRCRDDS